MKTKHVESLEDMVFRDKNKLYGAYFLRKRYRRYTTLSLIFSTFILLSVLTYPLIASYRVKGLSVSEERKIEVKILKPPSENTPLKPLPPPPPPVEKRYKFTVPKIVDAPQGDDDFGKQDSLADSRPEPLSNIDDDPVPIDKPDEPTIKVEEQPEPPTWVPEMPVFIGGVEELYKFLNRSLRYPTVAREINISGTVYLTFVVEKDGTISNVTILRGIGGGCDEEAVRVVKSMPPWNPGKNNGIPVRVRFNLPVRFTLE